jgi:hypothetical protein
MVDNDLLQEAGAVRERTDAEVGGQRLPEVGERRPRPEVDAVAHTGTGKQQRDVLTGVIAALIGLAVLSLVPVAYKKLRRRPAA